jgi:uncharacterized protein with GYD domain
MATFISVVKFTPQGIKAIDQTTKRAANVKTLAKKMGIKVANIYWTVGKYDGVLIFDAPDAESAATLLLSVGAMGYVQTSTMRAYTASEMDQMLANVQVGAAK